MIMSIRPVRKVSQSQPILEGAGVHLRRAFGFGRTEDFDPFLLLDDFRNDGPAAYRAGAMGPDPYFADSMPRPLFFRSRAALAGQMHQSDARLLLCAFLRHADSPIKRAYALGFLCHFALDANAHPYIFSRFPGAAPITLRSDL